MLALGTFDIFGSFFARAFAGISCLAFVLLLSSDDKPRVRYQIWLFGPIATDIRQN
ncbi:hypothetical protein C8N36_103319 [Pelagimonas varians]|uniref:Uncharacterized protein n=1 Tax=Pelagimonas varians TaxID=696760 RepID=A0A238KT18_9RHOB|nr:hypothetical protein C8N36_103319 [Pelagimonas varians]SMX45984.1 hypothetical protein PEV8663_03163 [Pelagimonas varians]